MQGIAMRLARSQRPPRHAAATQRNKSTRAFRVRFVGTVVGLGVVPPNPSFKRTPNGLARRPVGAGPAAHFAPPGQRANPPGSA
jgi:hypothetical protein